MAARRMKGVVRPHAMPTRRKPRIQRNMEGEVVSGVGFSADEAMVGELWMDAAVVRGQSGWRLEGISYCSFSSRGIVDWRELVQWLTLLI